MFGYTYNMVCLIFIPDRCFAEYKGVIRRTICKFTVKNMLILT